MPSNIFRSASKSNYFFLGLWLTFTQNLNLFTNFGVTLGKGKQKNKRRRKPPPAKLAEVIKRNMHSNGATKKKKVDDWLRIRKCNFPKMAQPSVDRGQGSKIGSAL